MEHLNTLQDFPQSITGSFHTTTLRGHTINCTNPNPLFIGRVFIHSPLFPESGPALSATSKKFMVYFPQFRGFQQLCGVTLIATNNGLIATYDTDKI